MCLHGSKSQSFCSSGRSCSIATAAISIGRVADGDASAAERTGRIRRGQKHPASHGKVHEISKSSQGPADSPHPFGRPQDFGKDDPTSVDAVAVRSTSASSSQVLRHSAVAKKSIQTEASTRDMFRTAPCARRPDHPPNRPYLSIGGSFSGSSAAATPPGRNGSARGRSCCRLPVAVWPPLSSSTTFVLLI